MTKTKTNKNVFNIQFRNVLKFRDEHLKPHSHCADVATVHPDAGQPVYHDAPGHIS